MSSLRLTHTRLSVSDSHHSSINTKGSGSASVPVINMKTPTVTESETAYYHRLRTIDTSHHAVIMYHAESGAAWFVIG